MPFLDKLKFFRRDSLVPPSVLEARLSKAVKLQLQFHRVLDPAGDHRLFRALLGPYLRLSRQVLWIHSRLWKISRSSHYLDVAARSPIAIIRLSFHRHGITRDADSFFQVSEKSTLNSLGANVPNEPGYSAAFAARSSESLEHLFFSLFEKSTINSPCLPFRFSDEQWAVLSPLLPAEPASEHFHGLPPVWIAANRWRLSDHAPSVREASSIIMEYRRITSPRVFNARIIDMPKARRGRPPSDLRPVLEGIFWKLSTGSTWGALPPGYPSWRTCQAYYRRLYRSGRLYTLLIALYAHWLERSGIDLEELVRSGILQPDSVGKASLSAPKQGWQLSTALLFVQLAYAEVKHHGNHNRARFPRRIPGAPTPGKTGSTTSSGYLPPPPATQRFSSVDDALRAVLGSSRPAGLGTRAERPHPAAMKFARQAFSFSCSPPGTPEPGCDSQVWRVTFVMNRKDHAQNHAPGAKYYCNDAAIIGNGRFSNLGQKLKILASRMIPLTCIFARCIMRTLTNSASALFLQATAFRKGKATVRWRRKVMDLLSPGAQTARLPKRNYSSLRQFFFF